MDDGRWLALGAVAVVAAAGAVANRGRPTRGSSDRGGGWLFRVSGVVSASLVKDYEFEQEEVEIFIADPDLDLDERQAKEAAKEEYRSLMEGQSWGDLVDVESIRDDVCVDDVLVRRVEIVSRPRRSFRNVPQQQRRHLAPPQQDEE
jgi:hypothetical protein